VNGLDVCATYDGGRKAQLQKLLPSKVNLKAMMQQPPTVMLGGAIGNVIFSENYEANFDEESVHEVATCPNDQTPSKLKGNVKIGCKISSPSTATCVKFVDKATVTYPSKNPQSTDKCFAYEVPCSDFNFEDLLHDQPVHGHVIVHSFKGTSAEMCVMNLDDNTHLYVVGGYTNDEQVDVTNTKLGLATAKVKKMAEKNSALTQTFRQTMECWNALVDLTSTHVKVDIKPQPPQTQALQEDRAITDYRRLLPLFRHALEEIYVKNKVWTTREKTSLAHFKIKMAHMVRSVFRTSDGWRALKTGQSPPIPLTDVADPHTFSQGTFNGHLKSMAPEFLQGKCRIPFFLLNSMTAGLEFKTAAAKHRWDNFKRVASVLKIASTALGQGFSVVSGGASKMGANVLNSLLDAISEAGLSGVAKAEFHRKIRLVFVDFFSSLMLEATGQDDTQFAEVKVKEKCDDAYKFIHDFYLQMFPGDTEQADIDLNKKVTTAYATCMKDAGRWQREAKARAVMTMLKSFIRMPALDTSLDSYDPSAALSDVATSIGEWRENVENAKDEDKKEKELNDKLQEIEDKIPDKN